MFSGMRFDIVSKDTPYGWKYADLAADNGMRTATPFRSRRKHAGFTKNKWQGTNKVKRKMAARSRRINRK